MLAINNKLFLKKGYMFSEFKRTDFYNNEQMNRFFWIKDNCHIDNIKGKFKVGLWFCENYIRQIQLFYISDKINEVERKKIHESIINNHLQYINLEDADIINYWNKRDEYSSIIINFNV